MGASVEHKGGYVQSTSRVLCLQTFLERLKNAVFYYGTLVGEQWRALPMYISLGKENNVDCLSTEVSPSPLCREQRVHYRVSPD